jgi:hypothetical protein
MKATKVVDTQRGGGRSRAPRTERRSRTGDGELRTKEVKDEIGSQRAELTPNAAVVEAASPGSESREGDRAEGQKRRVDEGG